MKLLARLSGRKPDADLEDRVARLERSMKALELEWDEMYDQFRRLYAKLSKRVSAAQNDDQGNGKGEIAPPPAVAREEAIRRAFQRMGHGGSGV